MQRYNTKLYNMRALQYIYCRALFMQYLNHLKIIFSPNSLMMFYIFSKIFK